MWQLRIFSCLIYLDIIYSLPEHKETIVNPIKTNVPQKILRTFPYLGALKDIDSDGKAFCTSTLIGRNQLATAAHCFMWKNQTLNDFMSNKVVDATCPLPYVGCAKVYLGQSFIEDYDFGGGGADYEDSATNKINIKDVYIHQSYFDPNKPFFEDDIALLVLESNVTFDDYTNTATLASTTYELSENGTILGWGKTNFNHIMTSSDLNYANITILDNDQCQKKLDDLKSNGTVNYTITLPPGVICSFGNDVHGSGPCGGDSGGPMVCQPDNVFCGTLSGSDECRPEIPAFYSSTSFYNPWLENTRNSIKIFPRRRISVELWHFEAQSPLTGDNLTPLEFVLRLLTDPDFLELFVSTLGLVPLQNFVFEMELDKTNWHSNYHSYLFQVKRARDLHCDSNQFKVEEGDYYTYQAMIPCLSGNESLELNFAHFIRTGDRTKVFAMIKKAAEEATRTMEIHDKIRLTSSHHNNIGVYLAVDIIDIVEVQLAIANVNYAGGYDISALICNDKHQCCTVDFGDLSPGSISTQKPTKCNEFQLDETVSFLIVRLSSSDDDEFKPDHLKIKTYSGQLIKVDFDNTWISRQSKTYAVRMSSSEAPEAANTTHSTDIMTAANWSFPIEVSSNYMSYYKAKSINGDTFSPNEFVSHLRVDEHFSQALLNKLTEVPFDMMSFSLRKLDSSRWNSSSLDYLFKVHGQNVIDTSCDSSDNNNKLIVMTKSKDELVVPCLLNGVQMPNLRHNNNETQVVSMLKKMAGKVQEDEFRGQPNNSVFDQALHKMFWDFRIVVATGRPHTMSRKTEVINCYWSSKLSCSADDIEIVYPFELLWSAGGVLEGIPTICGGYDKDDRNRRRDCWKLINSKWTQASFSLKNKRSDHASLIINNTMIITGGWDDNQRLSSTEILKGGSFEYGPELKEAVYGHCMVSFQSNIWIIGGVIDIGGTDQTWVYSNDMVFIEEGPKMRTKRWYHGCATMTINSKESIIVVGGYSGTSAEYLDTTTNSYWKLIKKELPRYMGFRPAVLTTPDMNAVIVYKGKIWQIISTDEGVIFEEIIQFSSIERERANAFLLPSTKGSLEDC